MSDAGLTGSIGNTLREARTKRSMSQDEVYIKIKIHPRVLDLLETDQFEKLPSPLFAKSFLKNYAEFLELDVNRIVQAYEQGNRKKEPEQVLFIRSADERDKRDVRIARMLPTLGLAAAIALGGIALFYFIRFADRLFPKPPRFTLSAKKSTLDKETKGGGKENADKSVGWIRSVALGNFPRLNSRDPLELKINAADNVWLRVTCDGKVLFQSILKPSAAESWKAQKSIEIWTGNSLNMSLVLNGHSLGSVGKGVIKKMTITHDGVKIVS
jgi:hypothetical protein